MPPVKPSSRDAQDKLAQDLIFEVHWLRIVAVRAARAGYLQHREVVWMGRVFDALMAGPQTAAAILARAKADGFAAARGGMDAALRVLGDQGLISNDHRMWTLMEPLRGWLAERDKAGWRIEDRAKVASSASGGKPMWNGRELVPMDVQIHEEMKAASDRGLMSQPFPPNSLFDQMRDEEVEKRRAAGTWTLDRPAAVEEPPPVQPADPDNTSWLRRMRNGEVHEATLADDMPDLQAVGIDEKAKRKAAGTWDIPEPVWSSAPSAVVVPHPASVGRQAAVEEDEEIGDGVGDTDGEEDNGGHENLDPLAPWEPDPIPLLIDGEERDAARMTNEILDRAIGEGHAGLTTVSATDLALMEAEYERRVQAGLVTVPEGPEDE